MAEGEIGETIVNSKLKTIKMLVIGDGAVGKVCNASGILSVLII